MAGLSPRESYGTAVSHGGECAVRRGWVAGTPWRRAPPLRVGTRQPVGLSIPAAHPCSSQCVLVLVVGQSLYGFQSHQHPL